MDRLSLRTRVFLFFCLLALGGIGIVAVAAWLGFRQHGDPQALSAFVTVAVITCFGLLALTAFVWLLFDKNVSKAIERIASQFRVHANAGIDAPIDLQRAKYLGDLAPAADAVARELAQAKSATDSAIARATDQLRTQRDQLLRILSDIPVAVIVASKDHQIVLYDGQAADLMEQEAPARLNCSVFDYLDGDRLRALLAKMEKDGVARQKITLKGNSGANYTGYIRVFDDPGGYTLMLEPLDPDVARPLVHDFDLLSQEQAADLQNAELRALQFVVFDSETTGLDPAKDDVVQLGAVRIVNGRVVHAEAFEALVNPGKPIPAQSTKVHGINDAMVADAPGFEQVRAAFHTFVSDAVIVAHNAPFDMAFLNRGPADKALRFTNPVMDTVHLSAIIFGGSATHTLDALCDRLRIDIPEDKRHTALGDAIATAEVFAALLPILEARGLRTFGQVREAALKHGRILEVLE